MIAVQEQPASKCPIYRVWTGIKQRCFNPNHTSYCRYGAQGVSFYEPWRLSAWAFYEAVGPRPSSEHTIDRYPNNAGNYEPGNVRWATWLEQNANRRDSVLLEHDGRTQCLSEWSREFGVNRRQLNRYIARGMSLEDAVNLLRAGGIRATGVRKPKVRRSASTQVYDDWSVARRGVDFGSDTLVSSCRAYLYVRAYRHGLRATVHVVDSDTVRYRYYEAPSAAPSTESPA